jgi:hypothetical protein
MKAYRVGNFPVSGCCFESASVNLTLKNLRRGGRMIIATRYTMEYDESKETYKIRNADAPICPKCGMLLSGYDTRPRHVIDNSGKARWFQLRRLRCLNCKKLHTELPDFMQPKKHYESSLIMDVIADHTNSCPADDATIRRWRKEKHPPGLPS